MNAQVTIADMTARAAHAQAVLKTASTDTKNTALIAAADAILDRSAAILSANAKDIARAGETGLANAMVDRLTLDETRLGAIAQAARDIAALPDPVGRVLGSWARPNGLKIDRVATPLGVIGVIYESRPNVTVDAGALCLKSGNAVILRSGSDALNTSLALHGAVQDGLVAAGLPKDAIQLIDSTDRDLVGAMLAANPGIDVIVPRGGRSLVERVQRDSRVPVFAHLEGICHIYVDKAADLDQAAAIVLNAKMRRTGICGAAETILIDRAFAARAADILCPLAEAGCELRLDAGLMAAIPSGTPAEDDDWRKEYLAPIVSARLVDGVDGALGHIARYGSGHTESILTEDQDVAAHFLAHCDSAIVMHNASTQFADGGEFGMGAEIGIATGRMHARGPVGLEQLTSFQYHVHGQGQIRP